MILTPSVLALPDDTLHVALDFLDPTDLAELQHVHGFHRLARERSRESVCPACHHPYPHCPCRRRSRWVGLLYFLFLLGLTAFCLAFPFVLPRHVTDNPRNTTSPSTPSIPSTPSTPSTL